MAGREAKIAVAATAQRATFEMDIQAPLPPGASANPTSEQGGLLLYASTSCYSGYGFRQ